MEFTKTKTDTFNSAIYIAGDVNRAKEICRTFVERGACVNISECNYIYTMGEETGVRVEFINYPRFPETPDQIHAKAEELGFELMLGLHQSSFTIVEPYNTTWYSRRED